MKRDWFSDSKAFFRGVVLNIRKHPVPFALSQGGDVGKAYLFENSFWFGGAWFVWCEHCFLGLRTSFVWNTYILRNGRVG